MKHVILFSITFLFAISSHSAFAVTSINWDVDGGAGGTFIAPIDETTQIFGNILFGGLQQRLSVSVDATDESDFITNGNIDTINVIITSVDDPNSVTYTLTETGPNTGIFTGTSFVFLNRNYKFQETDIVNLEYLSDPGSSFCSDNVITQLVSKNGGPNNGIHVESDTDRIGIGITLTETGENTCTFVGQVEFTATGTSDENTGTLRVSQGDLLGFEDELEAQYYAGQIIPTVSGKGSIIARYDVPDDDNTAEVTATYNGLSAGLDLDPHATAEPLAGGPGGGGTGGPVRPGLVLNFIAALFGGGGGGDKLSPPTLGLDKNQNRIVDKGFSFNDNPIDVEQFYTSYPLITTEIGKLNTIKLKIYENGGIDNIAHVGLSYGLGKGETFNEGRATIEYDRTFDGMESVTLFDPKDALGSVNVTTNNVKCSENNNAQCIEVTFDHIFRESLEYNMVSTNIWDFQRNGWQNYFNHGLQIVGESMNPPEQYSGIYNGYTYHLTETGKNTAIDENGNTWTFDKTWNRDYIKPVITESDILNSNKIRAIEQFGFEYSDGKEIFGFDRLDHRFSESKNLEQLKAQTIMNHLCSECKSKPFEKINNIFSYYLPNRHSKLDDSQDVLNLENLKAQEFLKKYYEKIYPGKIFN